MAIGSLPHQDPTEACALVMDLLPEILGWPQLPRRSPLEAMIAQCAERFPGAVVDESGVRVERGPALEQRLAILNDDYYDGSFEAYGFSRERASGLYTLFESDMDAPVAVKGQLVGPITWSLAVKDGDGDPIAADHRLLDAATKFFCLKAAWLENRLRRLCDETIIFLDEPSLHTPVLHNSPLSAKRATLLIERVLQGMGGLKGIHCCGDADWSLLLQGSADILSVDAYTYGESLAEHTEALQVFLARGGSLAFGIVPAREELLMKETTGSLMVRLEGLMDSLSKWGIRRELLVENMLVSPACGLVGLSEELARRALALTAGVS
ncbi:MAG: methionine synthase, partial [Chloroflexi bacterium]|nr:methionine synthase [Chloroflexota bacterium]